MRMRVSQNRKNREKIDLKIEMKNFGPISKGKITLKPLTVFIGANNSGKSYAAMLLRSIFKASVPPFPNELTSPKGFPFLMGRHLLRSLVIEYMGLTSLLKEFPNFKKALENMNEGMEIEVPKEFVEKIFNKIIREIYENNLTNEIIRSFASPLNDLIRIGKRKFSFRIIINSYDFNLIYQGGKIKIKEMGILDSNIKIRTIKSSNIRINVKEKGRNISIMVRAPWQKKDVKKNLSYIIIDDILDIIVEIVISKILKNMPIQCLYLPAARSGILQGHKLLAASLVELSPQVGIQRLEIPKFSGAVADFISYLLRLSEKEKGPFYKLARDFEKELIKGEIVLRTIEDYRYPEIKYKYQDIEIPLHRSSSTVSELAPLFLYLKYLVKPNSILIIEEPEAHLHPANQRILARLLVQLIRHNVNLVITTHSEYLLEQLSNFIMLSGVDENKRVEKYKYSKEDYLKPEEIAAYVFSYDKRNGGHKISEVKITKEDGISDEEFLKIHEALYEETIKLQRDLSTNE